MLMPEFHAVLVEESDTALASRPVTIPPKPRDQKELPVCRMPQEAAGAF
jgi:hypothetical protein